MLGLPEPRTLPAAPTAPQPHPALGEGRVSYSCRELVHAAVPEVDPGPHGLLQGMTDDVIVPERSQGLKWGCVWSPQGRPLESLWIPVEIL